MLLPHLKNYPVTPLLSSFCPVHPRSPYLLRCGLPPASAQGFPDASQGHLKGLLMGSDGADHCFKRPVTQNLLVLTQGEGQRWTKTQVQKGTWQETEAV